MAGGPNTTASACNAVMKACDASIKGLGELANVGTAAAIANAVYDATGKRIRKLPIRIEDLLTA